MSRYTTRGVKQNSTCTYLWACHASYTLLDIRLNMMLLPLWLNAGFDMVTGVIAYFTLL